MFTHTDFDTPLRFILCYIQSENFLESKLVLI